MASNNYPETPMTFSSEPEPTFDDDLQVPQTPLTAYGSAYSSMSDSTPPTCNDEHVSPQYSPDGGYSPRRMMSTPPQSLSEVFQRGYPSQRQTIATSTQSTFVDESPSTYQMIASPHQATTTSVGAIPHPVVSFSAPSTPYSSRASSPSSMETNPITLQAQQLQQSQNSQRATFVPIPPSQYPTSNNPTFFFFNNNKPTTTWNPYSQQAQPKELNTSDARADRSGKCKREYQTKTKRLEQENFYLRTQLTNARSNITNLRGQLDREGGRALNAAEFVTRTTQYLGDYYTNYSRPPLSPLISTTVLAPQIDSNLQIFADQGKVTPGDIDKEQIVAALQLLHKALCTRNIAVFSKVYL